MRHRSGVRATASVTRTTRHPRRRGSTHSTGVSARHPDRADHAVRDVVAETRPTILNVDDDEGWRGLKSRVLEAAGYRVLEAATGTAALAVVHERHPALVLLDVHLPGLDGFEVCRRLKADGATRSIPVLHVTAARVTDADWSHGLASGSDSYLIAPFSDEVLLGTIATLLQRARYEKGIRLAQVRAIDNLRESERRYRDLVLHAPCGIFTLTGDGRIIAANRVVTEILGYRDLTGMSIDVFFKTPGEWHEMRKRWGLQPSIEDHDVRWCTRNGRSLIVRLTGRLIASAGAGSPAFEVFVEDVSEQRRLEDERRHAQKMEAIGALAAGIAHDFNNLLTTILGYTELMLGQIDADKPIHGDLARVRDAGQSAAALTKQLLAFGRKQTLRSDLLNVNDIVAQTEQWLRRVLGEATSIVIQAAPDLPPIRGDRVQLEQVLVNLAVNARDAMADGGTLTIETRVDPAIDPTRPGASSQRIARRSRTLSGRSQVVITVSDTGCGMDAATRERIFEPFFTTKELGRGTGLGLATVYGIVKQLGGSIAVASEPGRGSTFSLHFPSSDGPLAIPAPSAPRTGERVGREHILLVEDDQAVRTLARDILVRHGYHVTAKAEPHDALRAAADAGGPLDLIVTDVVMPGMTGPQLVREVQARRPIAGVYMSGYVSVEAMQQIARDETFLPKPFSAAELLAAVRSALDRPYAARPVACGPA